jgi:glycerophosphoryl diester phosphodiesterase
MSRGTVIAVAVTGILGCSEAPDEPGSCGEPALPGDLAPIEQHGFVAHALGSPGGLEQSEPYSNTREAFLASYDNGFRAFEVDMILLADGEVLVAHDYREDQYGLPDGTFPTLTRPEVEDLKFEGKYEIMFGDDLIELMVDHPDAWFVLDTKLGSDTAIAAALVALAPDDTVRDRMVPHLTSEQHVAELAALHPFPERMLAHYRWQGTDAEHLERMARLGVDNIMMSFNYRWNEETQAAMDDAGHHVWVHTPQERADIERFRDRGVGTYTDGWIRCGER